MKKTEGFTLIELVIAIGLMTILFSMSIASSLNNFENELRIIENQIETSLYKALIWSKSNLEETVVNIQDDKIKILFTDGKELDSKHIGKNYSIVFENSLADKQVEISADGFFKRSSLDIPLKVSIFAFKENKTYTYDISMSGKLINKRE